MRWVVGAAMVGLLASLGLTTMGFVGVNPPIALVYGLFGGIFLVFIPAVVGHPAKKMSGTHAHVGWLDVAKTAPLWVNLLTGAVILFFVVTALTTSAFDTGDSFGMNAAELYGRGDRIRFFGAFYMVFYATSAQTALSGMRWWSRWSAGTPP